MPVFVISKYGPDSVLNNRPCSHFHNLTSKHYGRSLYCVSEEQESTMTLETEATLADESDPQSREGLWDKVLEQKGLYRGSYRGYMALYTLSLFAAFATFVFLAFLPSVVYPAKNEQWKDRSLVPFPLSELLTSLAFSSLSHLLRAPVFSLASLILSLPILENSRHATYVTALSVFVSCALYTIAALFLRLCSFVLLLASVKNSAISLHPVISTRDPSFRIAWWTGLGWAIAEATIAIAQGYSSISLYKDVFVSVHYQHNTVASCESRNLKAGNGKGKQTVPDADDVPTTHRREVVTSPSYGACLPSHFEQAASSAIAATIAPAPTATETKPLLREGSNLSVVTSSSFVSLSLHPSVAWDQPTAVAGEGEESELQVQVDRDIDHLLAFRRREELEELFGMPFIKIPVFVSCLHRVNAFLQSVGFSLLLSAAYIFASPPTNRNLSFTIPQPVNPILSPHPVWLLVLSTFGVHVFFTVLHTPLLLPKLGVHTVVYVSSMIALGTLFVGLAVWGGVS